MDIDRGDQRFANAFGAVGGRDRRHPVEIAALEAQAMTRDHLGNVFEQRPHRDATRGEQDARGAAFSLGERPIGLHMQIFRTAQTRPRQDVAHHPVDPRTGEVGLIDDIKVAVHRERTRRILAAGRIANRVTMRMQIETAGNGAGRTVAEGVHEQAAIAAAMQFDAGDVTIGGGLMAGDHRDDFSQRMALGLPEHQQLAVPGIIDDRQARIHGIAQAVQDLQVEDLLLWLRHLEIMGRHLHLVPGHRRFEIGDQRASNPIQKLITGGNLVNRRGR